MNFAEWFNPYSRDHLKAYYHLCKTGCWPEGFVPEGMEFHPLWHSQIQYKMSDCWLEQVREGKVFGVPGFDD